ncbi:MAG: ankyrin repeat domain-containing protein, partial [Cetobacterium sp.]
QEHACFKGAIDIVRFNLEYEYSIQVSWTITKPKIEIYYNYASKAAKNGHLDVIKLLHVYKYDMRYSPIIEAIRNNHLDVVRYLRQIIPKYPNIALEVAIKNAVRSRELKLLEYLFKTGIRANVNSLFWALFAIICTNDSNNEVVYFIYNNFEICRRKESINLCRRIKQPYKYQKIVEFFKNIRITAHPDIQNIIDGIIQPETEIQTITCDCG